MECHVPMQVGIKDADGFWEHFQSRFKKIHSWINSENDALMLKRTKVTIEQSENQGDTVVLFIQSLAIPFAYTDIHRLNLEAMYIHRVKITFKILLRFLLNNSYPLGFFSSV